NFLIDYPGCLMVVSHDRYFMDKIVDHLFVFRGDGVIEDFPGNYSDFRAYEDSAEPVRDDAPKEKNNWKQQQSAGNGLTFNEQKEFTKLEREIKDLEVTKKQIEEQFHDTTLSADDINAKSAELQSVIEKLEEKEMRWMELAEKME